MNYSKLLIDYLKKAKISNKKKLSLYLIKNMNLSIKYLKFI